MILATIDHKLSLLIHNMTRRHDVLHTVAVIFARWVFWLLLLALAVVVYVKSEPIYVAQLIKVLALSIAFGFIGNLWLGKIFVRKRPFVTHKLHALIPTTWLGQSFPSDHSMLSFAIALPLFMADPASGLWALILACLIALSRVGVGVHYISDVIVGSAVGVTAALLASFVIVF